MDASKNVPTIAPKAPNTYPEESRTLSPEDLLTA